MIVPERLVPLLEELRPLAERFAGASHRLYLVGGSVRDAILGRPLTEIDLDFTTDARPDDTEALLADWADETTRQVKDLADQAAAKLPAPVVGRLSQVMAAVRQRPVPAVVALLAVLLVLRRLLGRNS